MTKGLMDRALHHETALERVRDKARLAEEELLELKNWKVVTEKKLKLAEEARDEYQRMTEELKTWRIRRTSFVYPKRRPSRSIVTPTLF